MQPTKQQNGHDLSSEIVSSMKKPDAKVEAILREIESTLGIVPAFFRAIPHDMLESEWKQMRDFELSDRTALSPKVKELIGLAVAAATHCPYCTSFHSEGAKLNGASMQELDEALYMAKATRGWSAYLHGLRYDVGNFESEVSQIVQHVRTSQKGGARV